ncbi:MAG: HAD-IIA family hydrolase [Synergistaceae bacterium]|jgi:HAD superfamily hydrolase (TIGR01450 family)|nr:HAD-IIA family hydrolase [Synergistaceae bacterium]
MCPAKWRRNEDPGGLLKNIRCFALDMDGTLYLDDQWIAGALDFLEHIRLQGKKYVFLTNNSSRGSNAYFAKLKRMGLDIGADQLATSGDATIAYIKKTSPGKKIFLMGNKTLEEDFSRHGITIDNETPDMVVTAFDTGFDYAKMTKLCDFVRKGLPFIATHPDFNCPTKNGFIPDIGAIHAYVEASTGRKPDKIIGKPNSEIVEYAIGLAGTEKKYTAMVGDRLYTDIPTGINNGLLSVCVLSGESSIEEVAVCEPQPHLVFDSVREMIPFI